LLRFRNVIKIIVLLNSKREVSYDEGLKYIKENNIDLFFETSAKTSYNIDAVLYLSKFIRLFLKYLE